MKILAAMASDTHVELSITDADAESFARATAALCGRGSYDARSRRVLVPIEMYDDLVQRFRERDLHLSARTDFPSASLVVTASSQSTRERTDAIDNEMHAASGRRLYDCQRLGTEWLPKGRGRILADEMGLGKTMTTIAAVPPRAPVVVIGKAITKETWRSELAAVRPGARVSVLEGRGSFRWPNPGEWIVTSYELLPFDKSAGLVASCPRGTVLIVDEAQTVKNPAAARTVVTRELADVVLERDGFVWALTGTPIDAEPSDLWSLLELVHFRACTREHFDRIFGEEIDLAAARELLAPVMLRRRLDEQHDIPPLRIVERHVRLVVDAGRRIDEILRRSGRSTEEVLERIRNNRPEFSETSAVREALAVAKIPAVISLVEEIEASAEPLVVFSCHRAPVEEIGRRRGWGAIHGGTTNREEIVASFQTGHLRGMALTIGAGSTSITLTRAAVALVVDLPWRESELSQATGRIRRLTQTRPQTLYLVVGNHPLEQRVAEIVARRRKLHADGIDVSARKDHEVHVVADTTRRPPTSHELALVERLRSTAHVRASSLLFEADHVGLSDKRWDELARLVSDSDDREAAA